MKPWETFNQHHDRAVHEAKRLTLDPGTDTTVGFALILATLAVAQAGRAQALELRRIRKLLERGRIQSIGLTAQVVPKT